MRHRIELATKACYSLANSLTKIKGVSVAVTAFPAERSGECETVYPLLKSGETLHSRFNLIARGSTPMGAAIWWTLQQEQFAKESRKIILIITDGRPDSMTNTEQAIAYGKKLGFEFYGIGIKDTNIKSLLPNHHKVIHRLNDLAPAMFDLLQRALIK
jgi:Mg-chelatase subunit ChlD